MALILIIDDDPMIGESLSRVFQDMGHEADFALTFGQGMEKLLARSFDLVLLDVRLPDANGVERISEIRALSSQPEVIIITGYADADSAALAMEADAWDYLKKPASLETIRLTLNQALAYRAEKRSGERSLDIKNINRAGILGESKEIRTCLEMVARVAASQANILITGETGTGKERFARAVHLNSPRAGNDFVVVDCASLPENLSESLLFGHERGAFTGAEQAEIGLVGQAHQGTLFLDEIGDMPFAIQRAFLRVLQERRFRPLGSTQEVESDFRLVASTNQDLDEMVKNGEFRQDLLFRLRSITLHIPPLRQHIQDIPLLVREFVDKFCHNNGISDKNWSPEFIRALESYHWPGNARELFNVLERILVQSSGSALIPQELPAWIRSCFCAKRAPYAGSRPLKNLSPWKEYRRELIETGERRYLEELMAASRGNVKQACDISGLSAPRLYELLRKYEIGTR